MAEQMQARNQDHGDPLQKAPKLPWGTRTKNHLMPRAPNSVKGGLPHDKNHIYLLWENSEY
jgi:hypothetical protein